MHGGWRTLLTATGPMAAPTFALLCIACGIGAAVIFDHGTNTAAFRAHDRAKPGPRAEPQYYVI